MYEEGQKLREQIIKGSKTKPKKQKKKKQVKVSGGLVKAKKTPPGCRVGFDLPVKLPPRYVHFYFTYCKL